jgi:hypothetical protein
MESALARELRENVGYLRDSGFTATARLMQLAAAEIDILAARVSALERRNTPSAASPVHVLLRRLGLLATAQ